MVANNNKPIIIVTAPRIRLFIYSVITLGITSVLLWGLVSIDDPQATLTKISLYKPPALGNDSSMYLELELTNTNYFRGFNYTGIGGIEIFSVSNVSEGRWGMSWAYIPVEYQGFRDPLHWNFTLNFTEYKLNWRNTSQDIAKLKSHETGIYVSLSLTYLYKILLWITKTEYYTWLDTVVYLDPNLEFHGASHFHRTQDFKDTLN